MGTLSENCTVGQKIGSFYRIKNKTQGKEKQKMSKDQGNKCRAQRWVGVWGLADWLYCVWGPAEHLHRHERSEFQFAELAPQQTWLNLGPRNTFQHKIPMLVALSKWCLLNYIADWFLIKQNRKYFAEKNSKPEKLPWSWILFQKFFCYSNLS